MKSQDQSQTRDQEEIWKQKIQELQKKWLDTCLHHGSLGSEQVIPATLGLCSTNLISRVPFHVQPKAYALNRIGEDLQLSHNAAARQPSEQSRTPPRSPVRTELILGQTEQNPSETSPEKAHKESLKALGYISSKAQQNRLSELQQSTTVDVDLLKRLLKNLVQKVWWQQEAASTAAASVMQCRLGRRRPSVASSGVRSRVDTWLMFMGPDRIGKRKIASVLSEEVCGTKPLILSLGSRCDSEEPDASFRGKTVVDRIVEAVKRNPSSVIMLEDVDEADAVLFRSIKHAMEMGRVVDSHGREVSLGSIIIILTTKWLPKNETLGDLKDVPSSLDDAKLMKLARGSWQLRLLVCKKSNKRQANWLQEDEHRGTKLRKEITSTLSFDLNESAASAEDDIMDGSYNSSDLTFDHEDELGLEMRRLTAAMPRLHQLLNLVDEAIVFKPVDLGPVRCQMESFITSKFTAILGNVVSIEVDEKAVEKIVGGVWYGRTGLEEWAEKVLIPNFHQLKAMLPSSVEHEATSNVVVRLEPDSDSGDRCGGEWLPSKIKLVLDELGR